MILKETYRTTAHSTPRRAENPYPRRALSMSGSRYFSPELGRWVSRDPVDIAGKESLYAFVANRPTTYVDLYGLWMMRNDLDPSGFTWESNVSGESLKDLADLITGDKDDWVCIWPITMKDPALYERGKASVCDRFDTSNFRVSEDGPRLKFYIAGGGTSLAGGKAFLEVSDATPSEAAAHVRDDSGQGATPIREFRLFGHDGTGDFKIKTIDTLPEAWLGPSFSRALTKKGPRRCWFARNAEARFIGCSSSPFARQFARRYLRTSATSYGTNRDLTLAGGKQGFYVWKWWPPGWVFTAPKTLDDFFGSLVWISFPGGL